MKVLKIIWRWWQRFAHRLGVINTHVLLFLFYFFILGLFGLVIRLLRSDLLDKNLPKQPVTTFWQGRTVETGNLAQFKHQF